MSGEGANAAAPEFSVVAGNPTPAELAAVAAVFGALFEQLEDDRAAEETITTNAWQRSQRPIRGTITPGPGAWRGFSA